MIRTAKILNADVEEVGRKATADVLICGKCSMTSLFVVYQVRIDGDHYGHFHTRCSACDRLYCLEFREVPHEPQENNSRA